MQRMRYLHFISTFKNTERRAIRNLPTASLAISISGMCSLAVYHATLDEKSGDPYIDIVQCTLTAATAFF